MASLSSWACESRVGGFACDEWSREGLAVMGGFVADAEVKNRVRSVGFRRKIIDNYNCRMCLHYVDRAIIF